MTYIVERNTRFYVVAYGGLDPLTGRERRRWNRNLLDDGSIAEAERLLPPQREAR